MSNVPSLEDLVRDIYEDMKAVLSSVKAGLMSALRATLWVMFGLGVSCVLVWLLFASAPVGIFALVAGCTVGLAYVFGDK